MNTTDFLFSLRERNIKVWADGTELRCSAPKRTLTPDMLAELKLRKVEILAALAAENASKTSEPAAENIIRRVPRDGPLPLSFAQQRLWFIQRLEPDLFAYNFPLRFNLRGDLNVRALEESLTQLVRRHEVLRSNFVETNGVPTVVIGEAPEIRLEIVLNEDNLAEPEWRREVTEAINAEVKRPFDLARDPLYRFHLYRLSAEEHVLIVVVHHAIFDGASIGILPLEMVALYEANLCGAPSPLPELQVQYADYAAWQRESAESAAFKEELAYWRETLGGELPLLELPTDRPRPALQTFAGDKQEIEIPFELIDSLTQLAKREGATLFMAMLAAYKLLLMRHTGQEDLLVGTAINGRSFPELEGMIGFLVNTLVLRTDVSGDPTFRELLQRVREVCLGAYDHSEVPFERLVDELAPERNLAYSPIFQTFFLQEMFPDRQKELRMGDLTVLPHTAGMDFEVARTDLTIWLAPQKQKFVVWAEYNTDLFDSDQIARMLGHYRNLLERVVAYPDRPISKIPMLGEVERRDLLETWNATAAPYPEQPIHAQFEAQVERTPHSAAVIFPGHGSEGGDVELSYRELHARANRLAHYLISKGVQSGNLVGVCLERSAELPVSLLGILKTGAAYVPLDPSYPRDRIAHMVGDSGLALVVTTSNLAALVPRPASSVCLDSEAGRIASCSDAPSGVDVAIDDRMYVIYTSGSTGRPKGVELEHRSVSNFLASMAEQPGLSAGERLLAVTTPSFDISVLELFCPLMVGGTVIVAPQAAVSEGDLLAALLESHQPQVMQATPATWRMLLLAGWKGDRKLRIFCGGEAFPPELAEELLDQGREVWNLYGPTEATIWSTVKRVQSGQSPVPIGRPIASTRIYILDAHLQPVPVGVTGELFIGGDGLARGYLGRPELTAERFLSDPFVPGERIYRTGDLACYLPGGEIECLGRIDNQVKLRGFRIELGEVESVLADTPGVQQCVCVVREDQPGDERLVAYFASEGDVVSELRQRAAAKLPAYMVPSILVELSAFPLTPNGKVDRRALLALDSVQPTVETEFVTPRNEVERAIAAIWREVLGVERVGVNDNFFELGGNSLLTTQVMARIRDAYDSEVPLRKLFERPTVAELSATVAELSAPVRSHSNKVPERIYQSNSSGSLVTIQPNGSRPPLFLVSGAHAEEEEFLRFIGNALPHLQDQPIYGFKARGLDGLQSPHESVEEMAPDYILEMREVQPEGPYHLAGECVGGIVAYEMAQQLRQQGQDVRVVALLDCSRPTDEYYEWLKGYLRLARRERGRERFTNNWRTFLELPLWEKASFAYAKIRSKLRKSVPLSKDARREKRGRDVEQYYMETCYAYRPKPYHGKLTLVSSEVFVDYWKDAGWKDLAVGGMEIKVVPGDHVSRWTDYSKENARILRSCIDGAEEQAPWRTTKPQPQAKRTG